MRTTLLAVIVGLGASMTSAQTADVSGTWRLDPSRSDATVFGEPGPAVPGPVTATTRAMAIAPGAVAAGVDTLIIVQTGVSVTVQRAERSGATTLTSVLDGVTRAIDAARTVRGWTEGGTVMLDMVKSVALPGGEVAQVRTLETLSRQADGTLAVERTIESAGASRTWRFTYQPER